MAAAEQTGFVEAPHRSRPRLSSLMQILREEWTKNVLVVVVVAVLRELSLGVVRLMVGVCACVRVMNIVCGCSEQVDGRSVMGDRILDTLAFHSRRPQSPVRGL